MNLFDELIRSFLPASEGYFFMWAILLIGLYALALIFERYVYIGRRSDIDAPRFMLAIRNLLAERKAEEAARLCENAGPRLLPKVLGAALKKSMVSPLQTRAAVEEKVVGAVAGLEHRLQIIATCSNLSTLLGLMGTIYGLIVAFDAVGRPDVTPAMKTSMLASGISAAMNTTLLGLLVAVPCILAYSALRARVDRVVTQLDECSTGLLKILVPKGMIQKGYRPSIRRNAENPELEANMVPMMSLMTVLIPLLLTSTEFVKMANIALDLPPGGGGGGAEAAGMVKQELSLGLVVTRQGIDIKSGLEPQLSAFRTGAAGGPAIAAQDGKQNFSALNRYLAELKRRTLLEIARSYQSFPDNASLFSLSEFCAKLDLESLPLYGDHESAKIVAENQISYQTIVSVMDAARSATTEQGAVPLFPSVSIAGGLLQ